MKQVSTLKEYEINQIKCLENTKPHTMLGMHLIKIEGKEKLIVRAYIPGATKLIVRDRADKTKKYPLQYIEDGLFEGVIGRRKKIFLYELECEDEKGNRWTTIDPYQFEPLFSKDDLYLFGEGTNYAIHHKLGAHIETIEGAIGVYFAVWAPEAKRVSVVGDFNNWDGRRHPMRKLGDIGVWELFIPGVKQGDIYKYEIQTKQNTILFKSDPYGSYYELRPNTAAIVYDLKNYRWKDSKWMKKREKKDYHKMPMSIYEVHTGSWKKHFDGRFYSYRELADNLVTYLKDMHYTHVEMMGIMEYPFDGSWGYQVTGYFAPTSRYGNPDDFRYFVEVMHKNDIGVLLDWVPAHFPKDSFALEKFDGSAVYEHHNPVQANHPQWGTLIFNYGRNEVRLFLIASAISWCEQYHIDGLRVDAVASMLYLDYGRESNEYVPNCHGGRENLEAVIFLKQLNEELHKKFKGVITIAEESTAWPGVTKAVKEEGLGFDFKWNMGWMNDYLRYIKENPIHRKYHHGKITFSLMYAFNESFILPLSHDEVVHGKSPMIYKMPGDDWQKAANLRLTYGYMFTHPGKKMLFMGNDFGQAREWSEARELDWGLLAHEYHRNIQNYVRDLNIFYRLHPCLWELDDTYDGFEWIDCDNANQSVIVFIRKSNHNKTHLVIVVNFTPNVLDDYNIGVPMLGAYKEVLNSDSLKYGGSNVVNGEIISEEGVVNKQPYNMKLTVPPLATTIFEFQEVLVKDKAK